MHDPALLDRLYLAFATGLALVVAGAGFALFAPKSVWARLGWVGGSGAMGTAAAVFLVPAAAWVFVAASAVAAGVVAVASIAAVRDSLAVSMRRFGPRVLGGVAALTGGGMIGVELCRFDRIDNALIESQSAEMSGHHSATEVRSAGVAYTDEGTPIPLNEAVRPLSANEMTEMEKTSGTVMRHAFGIIRKAAASDDCNCHGWVFAAGRFHIGGLQVPTILAENGYQAVTTPGVGDVCVYRGDDGAVSHTAVVRAVLPDGRVLVEGKWGRMGVYLHVDRACDYGSDIRYYRADRLGHLLDGVLAEDVPVTLGTE